MSVNYIHGIETVESYSGTTAVSEVRTAVIGIVGTAPEGPVNTPVIIRNEQDAAQFGRFNDYGMDSGFTLPYALEAIGAYGTGIVVAVNVFQPGPVTRTVTRTVTNTVTHEVTDETIAIENGEARLEKGNVSDVTVKSSDGLTTFIIEDDYTANLENGVILVVENGAIENSEQTSLKVSYTWSEAVTEEITEEITEDADVADVTAADIVGSTDGSGNRTGAQALLDTYSMYGFSPKILIAPGFITQAAVRNALISIAEKVRAVVLVDAPEGATVAQALASRGSEADPGFDWQFNSDRAFLLYPHVKIFDYRSNEERNMPYSATMAGLIARTDRDLGYWCSPSNKELAGITGVEKKITSFYNDPDCEIQQLNEKGITSIMNSYGTGYRAYGNRLANYRDNGGLETFLTTRRVTDVIAESLERTMANYIDRPLTAALVNDILNVGNSFMRTLQSRGALINGSIRADAGANTAEELSRGHLTVIIEYTAPAALERITQSLVLTADNYSI